MKFIYRTDVHLADKAPQSWRGDYKAEILESLRQVGSIARAHKAIAVLDGGDFFHVKTPSRNSHSLVLSAMRVHKEYPCDTLCIEGNHDVSGDNLDSIDQQPLGVLYTSKVFKHLRDETFTEDGVVVRVVGFPYDPDRTVEDFQAIKKGSEDYLIAVVHALAAENPPAMVEEFFGEPVFRYDRLIYERGPDVFLFGHWHKDQGITKIGGRYFVNQGALSRGALSKENITRTPKVAIISCTKEALVVESQELDVAPANVVFDLERKERQDTESVVISQFVSQIQAAVDVVGPNVEESVRLMDFDMEVKNRVMSYLERFRG
jgi:exonuclease SbcD